MPNTSGVVLESVAVKGRRSRLGAPFWAAVGVAGKIVPAKRTKANAAPPPPSRAGLIALR
jgi:hypothetical protein